MAFLLFERAVVDGRPVISPTGSTYSLAGYNLLYKAWLGKTGMMNAAFLQGAARDYFRKYF